MDAKVLNMNSIINDSVNSEKNINKISVKKTKVKEKYVSPLARSLGEELSNAISHGVGTLLAIAGTVIMIVFASINHKGPLAITGVSIFGGSLILLYLASCLYHALIFTRASKVFQKFDHCMIFLLITGTYAPICLSIIGGWVGWTVLGINAACCITGIALNGVSIKKFDRVSQILYIIMGWSIVMFAYKAIKAIPPTGLLLLFIGGVLYTAGTIFYRKKNVKYFHFVWHLFVILGSIPHFITVLYFICIK
ncbi:MAG: hemolysin III family protein [Lachnospiraceae bacterium]|nr:hemolysin III family protein [Lachnospiraceae bacterium]